MFVFEAEDYDRIVDVIPQAKKRIYFFFVTS